jgi:hypothetical protein
LAGHPATGAKDGDYTNFFVDCSYQQLRFLFWFLSFVFAEGYLSGILVKRHANSGNESLRRKFIDRFLLSMNWFQNKEGALTGLTMQNVSRTERANSTYLPRPSRTSISAMHPRMT